MLDIETVNWNRFYQWDKIKLFLELVIYILSVIEDILPSYRMAPGHIDKQLAGPLAEIKFNMIMETIVTIKL